MPAKTKKRTLKKTFSVPEPLWSQFDQLASEMHIGPSKLFAMAFADFVEHRKSRELFDSLNEVYTDDDQSEELTIAAAARQKARRILDKE